MQIEIKGNVPSDPKARVLAIEATAKAICKAAGTDPADAVMMLMTAAAHLYRLHLHRPPPEHRPDGSNKGSSMTATNKQKSQQLSVNIKDGQLQISIGVALLAFAVQSQDQWPEEYAVSDIDVFSKSLARQLKREEEDGTTPVHRMLDAAAYEVIEQGDEGVDEGDVENGITLAKSILDAPKVEAETDDRLTPDQAWTELCETPDITSPEEYPHHALITAEQLRGFMERAI